MAKNMNKINHRPNKLKITGRLALRNDQPGSI